MQLLLRPPQPRIHPLLRTKMRHLGLGQSNINPTTIWTPQGGYVGQDPPAQYVAPPNVPVPDCVQDTRPGGAAFSAECQRLVMAAAAQRQAGLDDANRRVFVADCNRDWEANAQAYRDRGMAVPPNDCQYRGYGQTLPGTSGGYSGYLPNTPQEIIDWRNANPGGGSPGPASGGSGSPGSSGAPQFSFTNLTSGNNSSFKVGDRWQVQIWGAAPNQPVTVIGGKNGASASTQMGTTDSYGRFSLNGQMSQDQIGSWSEVWKVGSLNVGSFTFSVSPSGSVVGGGTGPAARVPPAIQNIFGTLPGGSLSIGGTEIPWVLIGGGVIVAYLLMRGK